MSYMKTRLEDDTYTFIEALAKLTGYDVQFLEDKFFDKVLERGYEWFEALQDVATISLERDW